MAKYFSQDFKTRGVTTLSRRLFFGKLPNAAQRLHIESQNGETEEKVTALQTEQSMTRV